MNLLHIDSSVSGEASASREISAAIVSALSRTIPSLSVVRRDLEADPLPHLDNRLLSTIRPDPSRPSAATAADAEDAAEALREFLEADVVVIGAPMYNFTVSTQLKAWLDRILIAGKMRCLFSMVFGASVILLTSRIEERSGANAAADTTTSRVRHETRSPIQLAIYGTCCVDQWYSI